jgi:hypothetical protein
MEESPLTPAIPAIVQAIEGSWGLTLENTLSGEIRAIPSSLRLRRRKAERPHEELIGIRHLRQVHHPGPDPDRLGRGIRSIGRGAVGKSGGVNQAQMTEIVRMLVDNLASRFWLLVVVQLVVAAVAAFAGAYLAQKGKYRADREDLRKLTESVEEVKRLSLIQSKTHEKVRERQIVGLMALYRDLETLLGRTENRAKPYRLEGEDEETLIRAFYVQASKTGETLIEHSLLINDGLRKKLEAFLNKVMEVGRELDFARSQAGTMDLSGILKETSQITFQVLPKLLVEIKDAARDVLRSENVEL